MQTKISVVIPAYNSQTLLLRCLEALEAQQGMKHEQYEVIVVDDGSTDDTRQMLTHKQQNTPLKLKFKSIDNSGPGRARNKGVEMAVSDWVAFLDADVIPDSHWLGNALQLIEAHPECVGFEGRTEVNNRHQLTPFTHQTENVTGGRYPTCNMVIKKQFCHFYHSYRIPFREDTDLAFCILDSGYQIRFSPELLVNHPPLAPTYWRPIKLVQRYYYDGLLRRRFPYRYKHNLDAHNYFGFNIPHLKKRLYGAFLLSQIAFLLSLACFSCSSLLIQGASFIYLTLLAMVLWVSIRHTESSTRNLKDMLLLTLVLQITPAALYYYLVLGYWRFRHTQPFDSNEWMKELGLPDRGPRYDIVMISTADWDNPFWTNKQHIASRLAKRGHRVLYIESLGLRQLTTQIRDLRRIMTRSMKSLSGLREEQPNVFVWSPLVMPLHRFNSVRQINGMILTLSIKWLCKKLKFHKPLLWTYNPILSNLVKHGEYSTIIYHCVDELKEAPGMPKETLEKEEEQFCGLANLVVTTSHNLYQTRKNWNPNTHYLPNPGEFSHFHQACGEIEMDKEVEAIPRPRLGFAGALSRYKVDAELLKKVVQKFPDYHLVLLGQIGEGEPRSKFDDLISNPNVHFLGPKPYKRLPHYLKGFDVALLPCPLNGYTLNMFPLKFFEYLAAGLPVVSTALPALIEFQQICYWTVDDQAFLDAIPAAIADRQQSPNKRIQDGIELARNNTWDQRVESILELLHELRQDRNNQQPLKVN